MPQDVAHNPDANGRCPCGYKHEIKADGTTNIHTAIHPLTGHSYPLVRHCKHGPFYPAGLGTRGLSTWDYWDRVKKSQEEQEHKADPVRRTG